MYEKKTHRGSEGDNGGVGGDSGVDCGDLVCLIVSNVDLESHMS